MSRHPHLARLVLDPLQHVERHHEHGDGAEVDQQLIDAGLFWLGGGKGDFIVHKA